MSVTKYQDASVGKKYSAVCFVFICQAGELEVKALLLAASIRYYNPSFEGELVAAIADETLWGEISPNTRKLLSELGVRLVPITSPFAKDYPIGNKLAAISVPTEAATTVFLDSDILCLRNFSASEFETEGVLAKPADFSTYGKNLVEWEKVYASFGLPLPKQRVLTTISHETLAPYFNAGVVAVANGSVFGAQWLRIAKSIDANNEIINKRPWLDQIALPVTATHLGYSLSILNEKFNFPSHAKVIATDDLPILCHYHWPLVLQQEPILVELVDQLVKKHQGLTEVLGRFSEWKDILNYPTPKIKSSRHLISTNQTTSCHENNFILTGMPRSGTSLVCRLLNQVSNTVVVNEPQEIFSALHNDQKLHGLKLYYRQIRSDILLQKGVMNKVSKTGQLIDDTRFDDTRRYHYPEVSRPDFLLGVKNPLAFLARLRMCIELFPNMLKIVTVRHPLDCIASWKRSFSHLAEVDLQRFPFAGSSDLMLDSFQHRSLAQIQEQSTPVIKRALLWNYLAQLISRDHKYIKVVCYENLVKAPFAEFSAITEYLKAEKLDLKNVDNIHNTQDLSELTEQDFDAVKLLCGEMMARFGYTI